MNVYRAIFHARCPVNAARIEYKWMLRIDSVVRVEKINDVIDAIRSGFHEDIADELQRQFGGEQILKAEHHGVEIETQRYSERRQSLSCGCAGKGFEFCTCQ